MKKIIINHDPNFSSPDKQICKSLIKKVIKKTSIEKYSISVIFGSDILVSDLKKKFFSLNQWTDVIAFNLSESNDINNLEAEIYISMPTAKENSIIYNEPYEKEIARLLIHGILHLIGYDDTTDIGKHKMRDLENSYLKQSNWGALFGGKK